MIGCSSGRSCPGWPAKYSWQPGVQGRGHDNTGKPHGCSSGEALRTIQRSVQWQHYWRLSVLGLGIKRKLAFLSYFPWVIPRHSALLQQHIIEFAADWGYKCVWGDYSNFSRSYKKVIFEMHIGIMRSSYNLIWQFCWFFIQIWFGVITYILIYAACDWFEQIGLISEVDASYRVALGKLRPKSQNLWPGGNRVKRQNLSKPKIDCYFPWQIVEKMPG